MKILGIETSCDETAICIIEATESNQENLGTLASTSAPTSTSTSNISILGNALNSQTKIHEKYGGVFPMMAKREHVANIMPLLENALSEAELLQKNNPVKISQNDLEKIKGIFKKEIGLCENFINFISTFNKPEIEAIAVTEGPGLEPALWVGINTAICLGIVWSIPVIPTNHMEGHIVSSLLVPNISPKDDKEKIVTEQIAKISFPAISLLISGGHTELVLLNDWHSYEIIGQTKDDAVGEAFDKVARMLELPYPGGPHISTLAAEYRSSGIYSKNHKESGELEKISFPRPMIKSPDFDFSFSGLKTAVLYFLKKNPDANKNAVACEFEDAATEVLIEKTKKALEKYAAQTLILGGGVTANTYIRKNFADLAENLNIKIYLPIQQLSTDNAIMIAIAGYLKYSHDGVSTLDIKARGNLSLQ